MTRYMQLWHNRTIPKGTVAQCALCGHEVPKLDTVALLCDRCRAVLRTARKHGIEQPHLPLTSRREFWVPVRGFEGKYEVSNRGRVRSYARSERRLLKQPRNTNGRPVIGLNRRRIYVHTVVAEAWLGPRPHRQECMHDNDCKTDNHIRNLRWGTRSENMRNLVRVGRHHQTAKTRCPQGHPYDAENTIQSKVGRQCRTCHRAIARESWARRKAVRQSRQTGQNRPQINAAARNGVPRVGVPETHCQRVSGARP
jgi:NUMOD4 motif/HNH endonuclease